MYDGGTTLEEAANAIHAKATISMQEYCTEKTLPFIAAHGQEVVASIIPSASPAPTNS
jgi:nitrogenase molybdenum-iron protein beta chain